VIDTKGGEQNVEKSELVSGFILELRRGTIILCVLSKLKEPTYGYNLIGILSGSGVAVEANTLYPLLRRLEDQGLLESTWNTDAAKPRKYYKTTPFGDEIFETLKKHWHGTVDSVNTILGGGANE